MKNFLKELAEAVTYSLCTTVLVYTTFVYFVPKRHTVTNYPQEVIYLNSLESKFSKCNIPCCYHVENYHAPRQGACMYCAVETIGNYLGIEKLKGFHIDKGPASPMTITEELTNLGVNYTLLIPMDVDVLKKYTDLGMPVVIGFHVYSALGAHACVVYHVDSKYVYFIDPNHPGEHFRFSKPDFQKSNCWWGIVLHK